MVHVEFGAIVPLLKAIVVPPLFAVKEGDAPHPVKTGDTGFARKTFAGKVSVRDA